MYYWFPFLGFCMLLMMPAFSLDDLKTKEMHAYPKMCRIWDTIEKVRFPNQSPLIPHAIFYDGGTCLDIFVTFESDSGFMESTGEENDVPESPRFLPSPRAAKKEDNGHFGNETLDGKFRYYTQNATLQDSNILPGPITIKLWCYRDSTGLKKLYFTKSSAVLRLSIPSLDSKSFNQDMAKYFIRVLQSGFRSPPQQGMECVDWRGEDKVINMVVKTLGHHFIRYTNRPFCSVFKGIVNECREERKILDEVER